MMSLSSSAFAALSPPLPLAELSSASTTLHGARPVHAHAESLLAERPVFSAYDVGRATISRAQLAADTGYDFSLPEETTGPAEIFALYQRHARLDFLPVRNAHGWIVGYLTRSMFLASLSESQYSRDLLFRKGATIQSLINPGIVCLDAFTSLPDASDALMRRHDRDRFDPFVVTLGHEFYGISTVDRVMRGINYFLTRDMDAVREAQMRLMQAPTAHADSHRALEAHAHVSPQQGPGGDFVKVYDMNEQYSVAVLFDVCGKGVRAAAMVSVLGSIFYSMWKSLHWSGVFGLRVLENELKRANAYLVTLTASEMYATGLVCLIDRHNHVLSVFDFGHGMLWLRRKDRVHALPAPPSSHAPNSPAAPDTGAGIPFFGISEETRVAPASYRLKPGDILLTCSDGILEQPDREHNMYGDARLVSAFASDRSTTLAETADRILADWNAFRKGTQLKDDASLLLVRCVAPTP